MITVLALVLVFGYGVAIGLGAGRIFCDYHHNASEDKI